MLESVDKKLGVIIDLKITDEDMENTAKNVLKQMKEKNIIKSQN